MSALSKIGAGGALVALAGTSWALSYAHLGHVALPVALGIAAVKAVLVLVVFMEIGRERASFKLALLAAALLLVTLLAFVAADVTRRDAQSVSETTR
jgi:cytochrome c oxidase subunit 4